MKVEPIIAKNWADSISKTVESRNLSAHMALISKSVCVYGIPGHGILNYAGWHLRRKNEFEKNLLAKLCYSDIKLNRITPKRVSFSTKETMIACFGLSFIIKKDIILEKESDGTWRVVEETIHSVNKQT